MRGGSRLRFSLRLLDFQANHFARLNVGGNSFEGFNTLTWLPRSYDLGLARP
jgi:hypothetical protein